MQTLATMIERVLPRLPRAAMAVVLLVLTLGAVLPAFTSLPPVDRDEARFAQATKQMVASGDPIDIRFQDGPRYQKPIGIYWLQAVALKAVGAAADTTIWKYRLVSLVAVLLSVLLTARIGAVFGGPGVGLAAGLLLAGVFLTTAEAHLATTDAALLAAVLLAQAALARLYLAARAGGFARGSFPAPGRGLLVLFWGGLAASVLLKGPVGPLVVGTTVAALALMHRRAGWLGALKPLAGGIGFLIVVLPWFVAITIHSGGAFWAQSVGHDLIAKVGSAQESHGAPPGSYLALLWLTFFPASVPLALSIPALWRGRGLPGIAFAAAWVVPSWIVFEASPTKLMHYTLPLYPALALAVALVWGGVVERGMARWQWAVGGLLAAVPVAVLIGAAGYAVTLGAWPVLPFVLALAVFGLGAALTRVALRQRRAVAALVGLWLMGAAFGAGLLLMLARVPALWPAPAMLALAQPTPVCPVRPIVTAFDEPSLVFLSPGPVRGGDSTAMADALAGNRCTVAVVADTGAFQAEAVAKGLTPVVLGQVRGMDLGRGKMAAFTVYALP
ncbi:MAG: glycosyltransferase family 39 protein [Rhodobacteraceae bacterium]|nr:glycosyltransferase family 39 protein [Paracoccaceae bacterium]